MTLRVAVGPFNPNDPGSDWPVYGCGVLAPDFEIVPFDKRPNSKLFEPHDVMVVWSPEYAGHLGTASNGYKVAVVGDWHIVPFEQMPWLRDYDLICADKRGTRRLLELGYPQEKVLYFRQFAHDPRLHFRLEPDADNPELREIDVAFMGRDVPVRRPYLDALREWGQRTGRRVHIETEYPRGREADIYRRSKIVFNYAQRGELNMRAYEAAACGALGMLQHAAVDEIVAAHAGIPAYSPSGAALGAFLEAWLQFPPILERGAVRQSTWVQRERPVDHLGWLCRQIKERMDGHNSRTGLSGDRACDSGGGCGDRCGGQIPGPVVSEPSLSEQRAELLPAIPNTAKRVLDVGCGTGGVGWALRRRIPAPEVVGVDADARVAFLARMRLTHFIQGTIEGPDADTPTWAALRERAPYDAILCLDVLEHLVDPWTALKRLRPLLSKEGVLLASVPNIRNSSNLFDLVVRGQWRYFVHGRMDFHGPPDNVLSWDHLRFFTRQSAVALLEEAGYRVERCEPIPFLEPGEAPERWRADLRRLVQVHGGDPDELAAGLLTIQWAFVCRPDWRAAVA